MTPETAERLRYLRELHTKYNGYLAKYFGFTMGQFAQAMGLGKSSFTEIIKGKWDIAEKHEAEFNRAFDDLKVMEKTKDFKESNFQLSLREHWKKQKTS